MSPEDAHNPGDAAIPFTEERGNEVNPNRAPAKASAAQR
jgi:hypothetical protein